MKSHVIIGAKMLNSLPFYNDEPIVKYGYQICRWHHEDMMEMVIQMV